MLRVVYGLATESLHNSLQCLQKRLNWSMDQRVEICCLYFQYCLLSFRFMVLFLIPFPLISQILFGGVAVLVFSNQFPVICQFQIAFEDILEIQYCAACLIVSWVQL